MLSPEDVRDLALDFIREYLVEIKRETASVTATGILLDVEESLAFLTDDLFEARAEAMAAKVSGAQSMEERNMTIETTNTSAKEVLSA